MDLNRMTRDDLAVLQGRLRTIGTAADALAEGDMEPEISLREDHTIITCLPVVGWGDPSPVVIEGLPETLAVAKQPEASPAADITPTAPTIKDQGGEAKPKADAGSDGPTIGPLTTEERREILRRHRKGQDSKTIAKAVNRRSQTVGLFIASAEGRGAVGAAAKTGDKPKPENGFRPIGEIASQIASEIPAGQPAEGDRPPAAAMTAPEREGDSAPVPTAKGEGPEAGDGTHQDPPAQEAPEAGGVSTIIDSMPGGDQGGLQQHCPAEHDPVQTGDQEADAAPRSPVEAPKSAEDRRILDHLLRLTYGPTWTVEDDLEICEAFQRGSRLDRVALELGIDAAQIKDRYKRVTAVIRDDRDRMTIDGQERVLRLLRQLNAAARKGAA